MDKLAAFEKIKKIVKEYMQDVKANTMVPMDLHTLVQDLYAILRETDCRMCWTCGANRKSGIFIEGDFFCGEKCAKLYQERIKPYCPERCIKCGYWYSNGLFDDDGEFRCTECCEKIKKKQAKKGLSNKKEIDA